MDVHERSIALAIWAADVSVRERTIANEPKAVTRWARRSRREAMGPIRSAYEPGPCGYDLQRRPRAEGFECQVIAPSLIPRKPGERIKTDRRDARRPTELLEGGLLTELHAPTDLVSHFSDR